MENYLQKNYSDQCQDVTTQLFNLIMESVQEILLEEKVLRLSLLILVLWCSWLPRLPTLVIICCNLQSSNYFIVFTLYS